LGRAGITGSGEASLKKSGVKTISATYSFTFSFGTVYVKDIFFYFNVAADGVQSYTDLRCFEETHR
jgi:hypothetical protein